MLFGIQPFLASSESELLSTIKKRKIDYKKNGRTISKDAFDFLERVLQPDPNVRIDWKDLYRHPLINEKLIDLNELNNDSKEFFIYFFIT